MQRGIIAPYRRVGSSAYADSQLPSFIRSLTGCIVPDPGRADRWPAQRPRIPVPAVTHQAAGVRTRGGSGERAGASGGLPGPRLYRCEVRSIRRQTVWMSIFTWAIDARPDSQVTSAECQVCSIDPDGRELVGGRRRVRPHRVQDDRGGQPRDRVDLGAHRAVGEGQRAHHRVGEVRFALQRAERPHQGLGDPLGRRGRRRRPLAQRLVQLPELVLHRGDQQMDLGREVAVEGAERDLRGLGDLAHLHRVEAAPAGQLRAGVQDPAAPRLLALGQRTGGGSARPGRPWVCGHMSASRGVPSGVASGPRECAAQRMMAGRDAVVARITWRASAGPPALPVDSALLNHRV